MSGSAGSNRGPLVCGDHGSSPCFPANFNLSRVSTAVPCSQKCSQRLFKGQSAPLREPLRNASMTRITTTYDSEGRIVSTLVSAQDGLRLRGPLLDSAGAICSVRARVLRL